MSEITLRELMDERDRRYDERHRAAEKAADQTERALTEYKTSSNEWRATLNDIVSRMLPRADYEREHRALQQHVEDLLAAGTAEHKRLDAQLADLRESRSAQQGGRMSTVYIVGILMALPGVIATVLLLLRKP